VASSSPTHTCFSASYCMAPLHAAWAMLPQVGRASSDAQRLVHGRPSASDGSFAFTASRKTRRRSPAGFAIFRRLLRR